MLTFEQLRKANRERCAEWHQGKDWDPRDWMIELAEECGEAAGKLKRLKRQEDGMAGGGGVGYLDMLVQLTEEIADVVIVADLLAESVDCDLGQIIIRKFNKTSLKHGFETRLHATGEVNRVERR